MSFILDHLRKMFDEENGVREISLEIEQGEFVTLLGPSGCGKTTILQMLGGFLEPDQGRILLGEKDITHLPPEERPLSTVFQNYALFTNMNVVENVSYGIRYSNGIKGKKAREKAEEAIALVGLKSYEKTPIQQLSGGQQQRVALARSIAIEPQVLLLDEPFSNLDAALRVRMRQEMKELQKKLAITMVFVTHDQEEAFSISDRIVVLSKGQVQQTGRPEEIYYRPKNDFVAHFVGEVNPDPQLRPEDLLLAPGGEGRLLRRTFLGPSTRYEVDWKGEVWIVKASGQQPDLKVGDSVHILAREELTKAN